MAATAICCMKRWRTNQTIGPQKRAFHLLLHMFVFAQRLNLKL